MNANALRKKMVGYIGKPNDFDFFAGDWKINNTRLKQTNVNSDQNVNSNQWEKFTATQKCWILLDGVANVDEFDCPERGFKGMSMRTLDLETCLWSIFWINSTSGKLLNPVIGGFKGDHGVFFGDDVMDDTPVIVRFEWRSHPTAPTWEQLYSWDGGENWELNWVMECTKV